MPEHHEIREVPYSAAQMYNLVANIEQYPVFIPWCEALRVRSEDLTDGKGTLTADMVVRYKYFRERFRSLVTLTPEAHEIRAEYIEGPFKKLNNIWSFTDKAEGGCKVDFQIDFEFRNILLQSMAMQVFDKAFRKMSDAFIDRAHALYRV